MEPQRLNVDKSLVKNTIPEYFAGKHVFVTGFTGFMGKYLIMTLLTKCPDIGNIYLLIRRSLKGSAQKKFDKALSNPLFDGIRKNNITIFKKLKIVEGDLTEIGLGLSQSDRSHIIENVSIIFHVAASVRFDIPLKTAILLNVRGTKELCELALELKKPLAFLHVSTSYCQIDKSIVEEVIYSPHDNWKHAIELAENVDKFELDIICAKYMEGFPNTYTFTKSLAESVVNDMCKGKIPSIICRPTVVLSAVNGPIPGWTDNFNGPVGLCIGFGKGIIRSLYVNKSSKIDFMPLDFAIQGFIKAVWIQQYLNSDDTMVYNLSCFQNSEITPQKFMEFGIAGSNVIEVDPVWHANIQITENSFVHYINVMLFQVLPAVFVDALLKASGRKPMLLKIQRRVFNGTNAIKYFIQHSWDFYNHKFSELDDYLLPSDTETFKTQWEFNHQEFFNQVARVSLILLIKEDPSKHELYAKKKLRLKYIHYLLKYTSLATCGLAFYKYLAVPLGSCYLNYLASL